MFGHRNRGPAGFIQITSPDAPTVERETLRCVHCGMHWVYEPGSGRQRGWCTRCDGVTCGAERCSGCIPYEAQIEILEGSEASSVQPYLEEYARVYGARKEL